jgi:hypothetical protein
MMSGRSAAVVPAAFATDPPGGLFLCTRRRRVGSWGVSHQPCRFCYGRGTILHRLPVASSQLTRAAASHMLYDVQYKECKNAAREPKQAAGASGAPVLTVKLRQALRAPPLVTLVNQGGRVTPLCCRSPIPICALVPPERRRRRARLRCPLT